MRAAFLPGQCVNRTQKPQLKDIKEKKNNSVVLALPLFRALNYFVKGKQGVAEITSTNFITHKYPYITLRETLI